MPGIHEDLSRSGAHTGGSDRSFGLVMATFFALIGFWPEFRGAQPRWWAVALAAILVIAAWLRPSSLRVANSAWMKLSLLISKVTNPLVLALMYCLVFLPVGALMRLARRDPLNRSFEKDASTYWVERQPPGPDPKEMANQF